MDFAALVAYTTNPFFIAFSSCRITESLTLWHKLEQNPRAGDQVVIPKSHNLDTVQKSTASKDSHVDRKGTVGRDGPNEVIMMMQSTLLYRAPVGYTVLIVHH